MFKSITFEDLPAPEITLELEYSYLFRKGNYSGLPENCFPDDEDWEINPPANYTDLIISAYIKSAQEAIKQIDNRIKEISESGEVRGWANEETRI